MNYLLKTMLRTVLYNKRKFIANFRFVLRSSSGKNERERKREVEKERGG